MSVYASRAFWSATFERALKTAAQGAGAGAITGAVITDGHALSALGLTALAGFVFSVVTSIASAGVGGVGPSLTYAEQLSGVPSSSPGDVTA